MKLHRMIFIFFLTFFGTSSVASEKYPSLLNVEIGKPYPHSGLEKYIRPDRPMTQFRSPNYGPTKSIFSFFSVSFLNDDKHVAIVTAENLNFSLEQCEKQKKDVLALALAKFPQHLSVSREESQLDTKYEYANASENTYFVLKCHLADGPFWTLHLQFRGKTEEPLVRRAWGAFLNK